MIKFKIDEQDKLHAEKVTLSNLKKCYADPKRNLYVDDEIVEGFNIDEIACAISEHGKECWCL